MIFVEVVGESSQKTKRCVSGESCRWIHVIQVVTTQSLWVFNGEFWHIQKRVYHFECQHDKTSSSSKWCQLLLASPPQWCHEFWAMSVPCCEVAATELQLVVITGLPSRTLQWNIPHLYILQVCLHLNHVNPGSINLVFFLRGYPSPVIICYSKGALRSESSTMCLSRLEPSALWTMLYAECISMYGIFTYKTVSFVGEMLVNIPYINIPYMEYKILNCQK